MTLSRKDLRKQRQAESAPDEGDIRLDPEVLRAVAKKMREQHQRADVQMPSKIYILHKIRDDFIDALEGVADDTDDSVIRYIQQKDIHGEQEAGHALP